MAGKKTFYDRYGTGEQTFMDRIAAGLMGAGGQNPMANVVAAKELAQKQQAAEAQKAFMDMLSGGKLGGGGMGLTGMNIDSSGKLSATIGQTPENKNIMKAREDLDTWTSNATDALGALNKIENYAKKLPKYESGFGNQLWAKIDANVKEFSKDPNFSEYLGVVAQEMIPMARKLQEEKGPITEFDVNRVEKGFGDKTTPFETRVKLIKELRGKLQLAAKNKMQVSEMDELDFANKYKNLYAGLFPEKASFILKALDKGVDRKKISDYLKGK